jgi:hypothetical protein
MWAAFSRDNKLLCLRMGLPQLHNIALYKIEHPRPCFVPKNDVENSQVGLKVVDVT